MKVFLYLAKRDKTGIKVLAHLKSNKKLFGRVTNLNNLNLPQAWESRVEDIVHKNRMLWELWVETADSYKALKKAMLSRGYTALPSHSMPIIRGINASDDILPNNRNNFQPSKTMIRKGKN